MKLKLIFLFVALSTCAFAQSDDPALKTQSDVIRFETIPGRNTGVREANMFDALKDAKVSRLESYTASGTNTYTLTVPWLTSYKTNVQLAIFFTNANTGASTINVNTFGAKSIITNTGSALTGGELKGYVEIIYDGTNFQIAWTSSIAGGSHSLTVDNSSLQLNSGTTYNGSADKTISVKNGGITNAMLSNPSITIAGNSTSLGSSVTQDQITGLSSTGLLKRTGANTLAIAVAGTDYLAPSGSGSGLSGVWLLASGGTLTGANTLIGTPTNRIQFVFNSLGTTQTDGAGLWLQNQNGALNGSQEISPLLTWEGRGFATGVNNSQSVKFAADVLPVQAATNPNGTWRLRYSINGAAYADAFSFSQATTTLNVGAGTGIIGVGQVGQTGGNANLSLVVSSGVFLTSNSNRSITLTQSASSSSWTPSITSTPGAHTSLTAATEFISRDFQGATQTWADGTTAIQRFNYFRSYTLNKTTTSATFTNAYNAYIEKSVAGSGVTITNNWALGIDGNLNLAGASASSIQFATTGGSIQFVGNGTISTSSSGSLTINTNNGAFISSSNGKITSTQSALTGGSVTQAFVLNPGAHTSITASTELLGSFMNVGTAIQQWATGTLTTQRFNYFGAPTVAFVGASTATNVYNLYAEAPIAGTNATISRAWAAGFNGNVEITGFLSVGTVGTLSASTLNLMTNGGVKATISSGGLFSISPTNLGSSWGPALSVNPGSDFTKTASTEFLGAFLNVTPQTQQWSTGALTTQRFNYFGAPTIAFVGASTATSVYNLYVEAPIAGTNATISNNYAAGFAGNTIYTSGGNSIIINPSTGAITWNNVATLFSGGTSQFLQASNKGGITLIQSAASSGWGPAITSTPGANTALTAATEFISRDFQGATQTWADGTVTTQRFNWFKGYTLNKTTTSATFTNAYTLYVDASTAGTGVTLSNNWALGLNGALQLFAGTTSMPPLVFQSGTNSTTIINGAIEFNGTHFTGAIGGVRIQLDNQVAANGWLNNGATTITGNTSQTGAFTETMAFNSVLVQQQAMSGTTVPNALQVEAAGHTTLTGANANAITLAVNTTTASIQFNSGAMSQINTSFIAGKNTYSFTGATTLSVVSALTVSGLAQAGTNATITENNVMYVPAGTTSGTMTNTFGLTVNAQTGGSVGDYAAQFKGGYGVKLNHLIGNTSAPSIAAGTGAGTSPTVSVTGNDLAGYLTITTGTGSPAATAIIATITFNAAYFAAPRVVIYPANRAARDLAIGAWPVVPANGQTNGVTTTTFVLESGTALATSTTYLWSYQVIQ